MIIANKPLGSAASVEEGDAKEEPMAALGNELRPDLLCPAGGWQGHMPKKWLFWLIQVRDTLESQTNLSENSDISFSEL